MPESPRWLVSKGRETQALKTLAYYHADGDENDGLVRYEFEEIKAALNFDQTGMLQFVHLHTVLLLTSFLSCCQRRMEGLVRYCRKQEAHDDYYCSCLLLAMVW